MLLLKFIKKGFCYKNALRKDLTINMFKKRFYKKNELKKNFNIKMH